jgi:hypothetical protein
MTTQYWIALRKGRGHRFSRSTTKIIALPAPDRETARRTAELRWPGYRVLFLEPLASILPTKLLATQDSIHRAGYFIDTDALSERFFSRVVYDEAVESCHRLGEDHEHAIAQLEDLRTLTANPDVGELARALEDVYNDVSWHFAREEMPGGLYRSISALGGHGDTLKKLHWDHLSILASLECIITTITAPMEERLEENMQYACPATEAFIEQWQQHEYREHMLTESVLRC